MKYKSIITILLFFIITACQDSSSILEPLNQEDQSILDKNLSENIINLGNGNRYEIGKGKIKTRRGVIKSKYSKNFIVNGDSGAVLFVRHSWRTKDGKKTKLRAKLTIPEGAFDGYLKFDMIFDLENYALELYPSPFTFNVPVLLDINFSNIDLSNVDTTNLEFTYLDGEEQMQYNAVSFNDKRSSLSVKGAVLHHFSRYGWTRNIR